MEQISIFEDKVTLTPGDLSREITSFDELLLEKLKKNIEGKCSSHGYVIPGSLELLSRSMGSVEKGRFTSDFIYYLKAQGKVLNPPEGLQVDGEVIKKNKMGLYVIINDAIRIMIPRDLHIGNEKFEAIQIGDKIRVEIKKSRFQVNDTHILSIAEYIQTLNNFAKAAEAEEAKAEEAKAEEEAEAEEAEEAEEADEAEEEGEAEAEEAEEEAEAEEKQEFVGGGAR
jgi:DNA-directed RNA polymerase subunit E'/Rpb7